MAEFTKEKMVGWCNSLIEETHTDISISRTDAHAESYRAQLALLEIALAALTEPKSHQPAVAITQYFDTIALDTANMVMCDVNRRDEFLGGDIQLLSRIQCRIDEACRAAMLQAGNSPVTPDCWIPVRERMPEDDDFVYIWPRPDFGIELHVAQYGKFDKRDKGWYAQVYEHNYGIEYHPITVTHWMPLPAAPQQEDK